MLHSVPKLSSPPEFFPTRYWHKLPDGRVQCDTCPRFCKLREGKRGACFVRMHKDGEIVLTSYGRSSGFCIDPIEKKPLNHFYPGSSVMSFGTAGCNLSCEFCQNWSISKSREFDTLADSAMPDKLAQAAQRSDCLSVAFTYNDPVVFQEYAVDTAIECHKLGLKAVAVSAGYHCPEPRYDFYRHMDAANIDLKGFTERFYRKICHGKLSSVLDTLLYLKHETTVWFEITALLIPDENDSPQEIQAMCRWLERNIGRDVPVHFTAFHPDFHMLDKPRTPKETLQRARQIALGEGLHFVYVGNVFDTEGDSTWCPNCNTLLIERDWYQLGQWHLTGPRGDQCPECGTIIPGKFNQHPGHFGRRRIPVKLHS